MWSLESEVGSAECGVWSMKMQGEVAGRSKAKWRFACLRGVMSGDLCEQRAEEVKLAVFRSMEIAVEA